MAPVDPGEGGDCRAQPQSGWIQRRRPADQFQRQGGKGVISLGVDGFKSRKAFDLWGLLAAHPARADLAVHEAELKGLLKDLAALGLKLDEGIEAQKAVITASLARSRGEFQVSARVANAGPQSAINLSLSAHGLSLLVGLPPNAGASTPSRSILRPSSRASTSVRPPTSGFPTSVWRARIPPLR